MQEPPSLEELGLFGLVLKCHSENRGKGRTSHQSHLPRQLGHNPNVYKHLMN